MSATSTETPEAEAIRERVKGKYGELAKAAGRGGGCCQPSTADPITSNHYDETEANAVPHMALAASLGCGNPTALASLAPGETVLDLGSGGGFVGLRLQHLEQFFLQSDVLRGCFGRCAAGQGDQLPLSVENLLAGHSRSRQQHDKGHIGRPHGGRRRDEPSFAMAEEADLGTVDLGVRLEKRHARQRIARPERTGFGQQGGQCIKGVSMMLYGVSIRHNREWSMVNGECKLPGHHGNRIKH